MCAWCPWLYPAAMRQRRRREWASEAACQGGDVNLYTEKVSRKVVKELRELCQLCPVIQECDNWMIVHDKESFGGGHTKGELNTLRKSKLDQLGYDAFENGWLEDFHLLSPKQLEDFEEMRQQKERLRRRRSAATQRTITPIDLSDVLINF